ncbi:MAG: hypothetical protein QXP31_00040 [Pyrobaculum sp.]
MAPRLFPREWTIVGVLTTDLALALALGLPSEAWRVAAVVVAYVIHLTTFSALFETASRRQVSIPLYLLNGAPYVPAVFNTPPPVLAYVAGLFVAVLLTAAGGRIRTPVGYVTGLTLYASMAILMRHLLGTPAPSEYVAMALYVAYFATFALYVESRLAFRNLDPAAPLAVWLPAAAYAVACLPSLIIAVAEPTYLLAKNVAKNEKVKDVESIKKMGRRILASSIVFTALLVAAYKLLSLK